jgi:hypothetical protein
MSVDTYQQENEEGPDVLVGEGLGESGGPGCRGRLSGGGVSDLLAETARVRTGPHGDRGGMAQRVEAFIAKQGVSLTQDSRIDLTRML